LLDLFVNFGEKLQMTKRLFNWLHEVQNNFGDPLPPIPKSFRLMQATDYKLKEMLKSQMMAFAFFQGFDLFGVSTNSVAGEKALHWTWLNVTSS